MHLLLALFLRRARAARWLSAPSETIGSFRKKSRPLALIASALAAFEVVRLVRHRFVDELDPSGLQKGVAPAQNPERHRLRTRRRLFRACSTRWRKLGHVRDGSRTSPPLIRIRSTRRPACHDAL
jgi:hypothetical protein